MYYKTLIKNINLIHTTELGKIRIIKNTNIDSNDPVEYIKNKLLEQEYNVSKKGKNYYLEIDNNIITINSYNYCIITAHRK